MRWNPLPAINEALKQYHLVEEKLKVLEQDSLELLKTFNEIRLEHVKLEGRVSRLEESRETIKAQMHEELAKAIKEIEIASVKADAERYKEFIDLQATLRLQATTPTSSDESPKDNR